MSESRISVEDAIRAITPLIPMYEDRSNMILAESIDVVVDCMNEVLKLRSEVYAARKWAKLWKMTARGERILKEQAVDALCEVNDELDEARTTIESLY